MMYGEENYIDMVGFYITEAIFHNFMSHEHTVIKLGRGLNIFVGETDSGKTAMRTGYTWALFNEPKKGDDFVRWKDGSKEIREDLCYVTLKFSNGIELTRKRQKNKNIYELVDEDGVMHSFEGFGEKIPEFIVKKLGIKKLVLDDKNALNLHISGVEDIPIIYQSGPTKAKAIGAFVGTNAIDTALKGVNADIREITSSINKKVEDIKSYDKKIADFGDMAEQEKILDQIDNIYFSLSEEDYLRSDLVKSKQRIDEKVLTISQCKKTLSNIVDTDKLELEVLRFESLLNEAKELTEKRNRLYAVKKKIDDRKQDFQNCKKILEQTKHIEQKEIEVNKLEKNILELQKNTETVKSKKQSLLTYKTRIDDNKKSIQSSKNVLEKYKNTEEKEKELTLIEKALQGYENKIQNKEIEKDELLALKKSIDTRIENHKKGEEWLKRKKVHISNLINECVDDIKKLGKCPMCLSDINEEHLVTVKKELEEM